MFANRLMINIGLGPFSKFALVSFAKPIIAVRAAFLI